MRGKPEFETFTTTSMVDAALRATYPNLMERKPGTAGSGQRWTMENLKDGLQYFFELNKRYPTALEIDAFTYLPSARAIQRSFGGLVNLRTTLGLSGPVDFSKGESRSEQAKNADIRAKAYEEEFFHFLTSKLPEYRIHEHKIIRPGGVASDFFVYTSHHDGVVIDLFFAQDLQSVRGVVRIKTLKYSAVPFAVLYILVGNKGISQKQLDDLLQGKEGTFPKHIKLLTEDTFKNRFDHFIRSRWEKEAPVVEKP